MKVLEVNEQFVLVQDDDGIHKTLPNDMYMQIKKHYIGNRIFFSWDKEHRVEETYDNRIFNCIRIDNDQEQRVQLNNNHLLYKAIKDNNVELYNEIFEKKLSMVARDEVLEKNFSHYGNHVERNRKGYVINGMFLVDDSGTAFYKNIDDKKHMDWCHLCLVVQDFHPRKISLEGVGTIRLDETLIQIIEKVAFCLHPNLEDGVVKGQLPKWIIDEVKRDE
jgi:hypothetical protein